MSSKPPALRRAPVAVLLWATACAGQSDTRDPDASAATRQEAGLDASSSIPDGSARDDAADPWPPPDAGGPSDATVSPWLADAFVSPDGAVVCGDPETTLNLSAAEELEGCVVFRGGLRFGDTQFTALPFPSSLRHIEGTLNLFRNQNLVDISALRGLVSVHALFVHHNFMLETLTGLEGLREVHHELYVTSNANLTSLDGLAGLETVGAPMSLGGNDSLPASDIEQLMERVRVVDGGVRAP